MRKTLRVFKNSRNAELATPKQMAASCPRWADVEDAEGAEGDRESDELTLLIQPLPPRFTEQRLRRELARRGYGGQYDYVHVPWNHRSNKSRGMAFINFTSVKSATLFQKQLQGVCLAPGAPACLEIAPAVAQGLHNNLLLSRERANCCRTSARRGAGSWNFCVDCGSPLKRVDCHALEPEAAAMQASGIMDGTPVLLFPVAPGALLYEPR